MKLTALIASGFLLLAAPAFAQNATVQGGGTTPGNAAGDPAPGTPQGQVTTTQVGPSVATPGMSVSPSAMSPIAPK